MTTNKQVFLDANVLVYAIDKSSKYYGEVVGNIQNLLQNNVTLCTSHHVIEEVLYVINKVSNYSTSRIIDEIAKIPDLVLIEPDANLRFAKRYAKLSDKLSLGINDALLLQLMLDAGIPTIYSYDKKFVIQATKLGINSAS